MDVKRLIRLEYLSILELNGEGSFQLLQGQITSDMDKVSEINSEIGAICDIKGRVVSSFCIIPKAQDEGYYLIGDKEVNVEQVLGSLINSNSNEIKASIPEAKIEEVKPELETNKHSEQVLSLIHI